MDGWLLGLIAYGVCALIVFLIMMVTFSRQHNSAGPEVSDGELIMLVAIAVGAAVGWPLLVLGVLAMRLRPDTSGRR